MPGGRALGLCHQARSGAGHLSRPSWTPLHAEPDRTKKRKRGGLRPHSTHVSASGRLGSQPRQWQPRQEQDEHDAMPAQRWQLFFPSTRCAATVARRQKLANAGRSSQHGCRSKYPPAAAACNIATNAPGTVSRRQRGAQRAGNGQSQAASSGGCSRAEWRQLAEQQAAEEVRAALGLRPAAGQPRVPDGVLRRSGADASLEHRCSGP